VIKGSARFEAVKVVLIEPELAVLFRSGASAASGGAVGSILRHRHLCGHR
jgi:hypothetical protein